MIMALPDYSMRHLLEAGVHLATIHRGIRRWRYFGTAWIHIIDLSQSVPMLPGLQAVTTRRQGRAHPLRHQAPRRMLSPTRQALRAVLRNSRGWAAAHQLEDHLGSISRCESLRRCFSNEAQPHKKSRLELQRERDKLDRAFAASRTWSACPTSFSGSTPTKRKSR